MPCIGDVVGEHETGLITVILAAVYTPESIEFHHVSLPYQRAVEEVVTGKIDCTLDVLPRKGTAQASATMAFYDLSAAYLHKTGWQGVQSLKGKPVAYLHGFNLENLVPVTFSPQVVYDLSSAYHLLDRGDVAYILDDNYLLKQALHDSRLPAAGFAISRIQSFKVKPIFSDTATGRLYRDIYDRRIKEMLADGELVEIFEKHGLKKEYVDRIRQANEL